MVYCAGKLIACSYFIKAIDHTFFYYIFYCFVYDYYVGTFKFCRHVLYLRQCSFCNIILRLLNLSIFQINYYYYYHYYYYYYYYYCYNFFCVCVCVPQLGRRKVPSLQREIAESFGPCTRKNTCRGIYRRATPTDRQLCRG